MKTWKNKNAEKKWKMLLQNTEKIMKKELDTEPYHPNIPQQLRWYRIILGKFDTIQYPRANRGTTLIKKIKEHIIWNTES